MINIKLFDYLPEEAKEIRYKVFVDEQKFYDEFDEADDISIHLVMFIDEKPAGTARMFTENNGKSYHIGRVAVLKEFRGQQLGSAIIKVLISKAQDLGAEKLELSSQCRVKDFYKGLGFIETGEIYYDEYCPHIHMEKTL